MRKLLIMLAVLAEPLIMLAALVGLAVGIALKFDTPTSAIVLSALILIDMAVESRGRGSPKQ